MMRANARGRLPSFVVAMAALLAVNTASSGVAQTPGAREPPPNQLQAAGSPLSASRPLGTTRQPAPPLYCLTRTAACDNMQRVREGEKCSCPGGSGLGLVRRYEDR